jgi:putative hemolysin
MNLETFALHTSESTPVHKARAEGVPAAISGKFAVRWASCEQDVREAQRLRYLVFAEEMGACLNPPAGTPSGLDADGFDPFCDHLMVSSVIENSPNGGKLIGTYRVLPPQAARRAGGLYIDTEFDLAPLSGLRGHAVELSRSDPRPGHAAAVGYSQA